MRRAWAGLAGQVMGEFIRTRVAPEMDAYILSKLAKLASDQDPHRHRHPAQRGGGATDRRHHQGTGLRRL